MKLLNKAKKRTYYDLTKLPGEHVGRISLEIQLDGLSQN